MRKLAILSLLALSSCVFVADGTVVHHETPPPEVQVVVGWDDCQTLIYREYFGFDWATIGACEYYISDYGFDPGDMFVLAFISAWGRADIHEVCWRYQTQGFQLYPVLAFYRIEPEVLFVSIPANTPCPPPYGRAYGFYWRHQRGGLTNDECRALVELHIGVHYFGYSYGDWFIRYDEYRANNRHPREIFTADHRFFGRGGRDFHNNPITVHERPWAGDHERQDFHARRDEGKKEAAQLYDVRKQENRDRVTERAAERREEKREEVEEERRWKEQEKDRQRVERERREQEERQRKEEEARKREEERRAEETRRREEQERKRVQAEEERRKAEEERQRKQAEQEQRRREEQERKAQEERQRKENEARKREEERKAAEERRNQEQAERERKNKEEQDRRKQEAERERKNKEEQDRSNKEEEQRKKDDEQRKNERDNRKSEEQRKQDEEKQNADRDRQRKEDEARKQEEDRQRKESEARKQEEDRQRKESEARKQEEERLAQEARRKAEEERVRAEAEKRQAEEDARRKADEDRRKKEDEEKTRPNKGGDVAADQEQLVGRTRTLVTALCAAIEAYHAEKKAYPDSGAASLAAALQSKGKGGQPFFKFEAGMLDGSGAVIDAFGRSIQYQNNAPNWPKNKKDRNAHNKQGFDLASAGTDGSFGGKDDIANYAP